MTRLRLNLETQRVGPATAAPTCYHHRALLGRRRPQADWNLNNLEKLPSAIRRHAIFEQDSTHSVASLLRVLGANHEFYTNGRLDLQAVEHSAQHIYS